MNGNLPSFGLASVLFASSPSYQEIIRKEPLVKRSVPEFEP